MNNAIMEGPQPAIKAEESKSNSSLARTPRRKIDYVFDFGIHRGKRLDEVPLWYIRCLQNKNAKRPRFQAAAEQFAPRFSQARAVASLNTPCSTKQGPSSSHNSSPSKKPNSEPRPLASPPLQHPETQSADSTGVDLEDLEAATPYVLTFGTQKGKTLSECNAGYVYAIQNILKNPDNSIDSPELRAALKTYWDSSNTTEPEIVDWAPPTTRAPTRFRDGDCAAGRSLWISIGQTKTFFRLQHRYLSQLKPLKGDEGQKRYWLYHVWDFVRVKDGQAVADAGLRRFKKQKQVQSSRSFDDVCASMGFGACLDL